MNLFWQYFGTLLFCHPWQVALVSAGGFCMYRGCDQCCIFFLRVKKFVPKFDPPILFWAKLENVEDQHTICWQSYQESAFHRIDHPYCYSIQSHIFQEWHRRGDPPISEYRPGYNNNEKLSHMRISQGLILVFRFLIIGLTPLTYSQCTFLLFRVHLLILL